MRWLVVPRVGAEARSAPTRAASRVAILAAALLVPALALVFVRQLLEFRDPFAPWQEDARLLLAQTEWGTLWLRASGAALVFLAVAGAAARRTGPALLHRALWGVLTLLAVALAAFPAFSGHAAGVETRRGVALTADWLHVLAAGSWIGGLTVLLAAARSLRAADGTVRAGPFAELVRAFSPLALTSVAVLLLTGAYGSWLHIESWDALTGTTYGRLLVAKLAVVTCVLALGALNWRRFTPRLGRAEGGERALLRAATVELALAHLVILITALLVRTSPLHDWSWRTIGH